MFKLFQCYIVLLSLYILYRQEYLVSKVIRNEADEAEDEFVDKKVNNSFGITDYDTDYYRPEEEVPVVTTSNPTALVPE